MFSLKFRFFIIEKDSFVARDMQDGLLAAIPDCDARHLLHHDEARQIAAQGADGADTAATRSVIVTKMSLDQLDRTGLAGLARDLNADVVVRMGEDPVAAVAARGWFSLASPFTWDDLNSLVSELSNRTAAA